MTWYSFDTVAETYKCRGFDWLQQLFQGAYTRQRAIIRIIVNPIGSGNVRYEMLGLKSQVRPLCDVVGPHQDQDWRSPTNAKLGLRDHQPISGLASAEALVYREFPLCPAGLSSCRFLYVLVQHSSKVTLTLQRWCLRLLMLVHGPPSLTGTYAQPASARRASLSVNTSIQDRMRHAP